MRAAKYVTPTVSLNENDMRGQLAITTKHSRRDNFNTVIGTFKGIETEDQASDYTPVTDAAYVTEDAGREVTRNLDLLFTDTDAMAQDLAGLALKRNRQQVTVQGNFGLGALDVMIGDNVSLTDTKASWTDKVFECVDWKFMITPDQDLQIAMILRENNSSVYA